MSRSALTWQHCFGSFIAYSQGLAFGWVEYDENSQKIFDNQSAMTIALAMGGGRAALTAGGVFTIGNYLLTIAIQRSGLAVAFPVGVGVALGRAAANSSTRNDHNLYP